MTLPLAETPGRVFLSNIDSRKIIGKKIRLQIWSEMSLYKIYDEKWKNKIYDFEQLSLWCCHFFLKRDRRMRISLAVSKFDVDVPRLKYDQNRPARTQDKCHLIESQICQNAFLILNSIHSLILGPPGLSCDHYDYYG